MDGRAVRRKKGSRSRRAAKDTLSGPENFVWSRLTTYFNMIFGQTFLVRVIVGFTVLWLLFAAALFLAERSDPNSTISSYGAALYWSVAAFSTAGIADAPKTGLAQFVGAVWIVAGSIVFFGTIVATITSYFMRPIERPVNQIIETIEYNLERLDDLTVDELALLKKTSDALIVHMGRLKEREADSARSQG